MVSFTKDEIESIFMLAEKLTGSCQSGKYRKDILVTNVSRRIEISKKKNLNLYLNYALNNPEEKMKLISALTIHTTSWFRESPHYELLEMYAIEFSKKKPNEKFRFLTVANSTGEEVYSAGLILECVRNSCPTFDYELIGTDIDPVSLKTAANAIYKISELSSIPSKYHSWVLRGTKKTNGLMTIDENIRKRAKFIINNLSTNEGLRELSKFDWIMCRNVLIYFDLKVVSKIEEDLLNRLNNDGILCLGHSESMESTPTGFTNLGMACYKKSIIQVEVKNNLTQKKILVVDDSTSVRKVISNILMKDKFQITEAESAAAASIAIRRESFDLVTLDLNMPVEDGPSWLKKERKAGFKVPVIIVSDANPKEAEKILGALEDGAQDYIVKSILSQSPQELTECIHGLLDTNKNNIFSSKLIHHKDINNIKYFKPEIILIGASTGGPEALWKLLKTMPGYQCPPIMVVQHINSAFAFPFADRLKKVSGLDMTEPKDGEPLQFGKLYLSWDSYHIGLKRLNDQLCIKLSYEDKINGHKPAVDYMFDSAANVKAKSLNILLTGMGRDGAKGMKALFENNNVINIAQDEDSSVVYGMPKEAVLLGAVHYEGDLQQIRHVIENAIQSKEIKKIA